MGGWREGGRQGLKQERSLSRDQVGLVHWEDHGEAGQSLGPIWGVVRGGGLEPRQVTKGQTTWEAKVISVHYTN